MPIDDRQNNKNMHLLNAILALDPWATKRALEEGADATACVDESERMGDGRKWNLFELAIYWLADGCVQMIMNHYEGRKIYIDLTKDCETHDQKDDVPCFPMSKFLFACKYGSNLVIEMLAKHFYNNPNNEQNNLEDVLNMTFVRSYRKSDCTNISESILEHISRGTIKQDSVIANDSEIYEVTANKVISQFFSIRATKIDVTLPGAAKGRLEAIELDVCHTKRFELLVRLGLDPKPLLDAAKKILKAARNPQAWNLLVAHNTLQLDHIRLLGAAYLNKQGKLSVKVELIDIHGNHKQLAVVLTFNYAALVKFAQDAIDHIRMRMAAAPTRAIVGDNRQNTSLQITKADMFAVPDIRIDYIHKEMFGFPNTKLVFDRIQQHLDSYLDLQVKADTGLITLNPSKFVRDNKETAIFVIKNVIDATKFASQFVPFPGASLIPMVFGGLVSIAEKMYKDKVSDDMATTMLGKNLHRIAIDVAYIFALHAFCTYGEEITETQIDMIMRKALSKAKELPGKCFANEAGLVYFVAESELCLLSDQIQRLVPSGKDTTLPSAALKITTGVNIAKPKALPLPKDVKSHATLGGNSHDHVTTQGQVNNYKNSNSGSVVVSSSSSGRDTTLPLAALKLTDANIAKPKALPLPKDVKSHATSGGNSHDHVTTQGQVNNYKNSNSGSVVVSSSSSGRDTTLPSAALKLTDVNIVKAKALPLPKDVKSHATSASGSNSHGHVTTQGQANNYKNSNSGSVVVSSSSSFDISKVPQKLPVPANIKPAAKHTPVNKDAVTPAIIRQTPINKQAAPSAVALAVPKLADASKTLVNPALTFSNDSKNSSSSSSASNNSGLHRDYHVVPNHHLSKGVVDEANGHNSNRYARIRSNQSAVSVPNGEASSAVTTPPQRAAVKQGLP
jgi:hypothetical protein